MNRSSQLILFYALFAIVFLAAFLMVGAPARNPVAPASNRLGLLPAAPATPQSRDTWFDHPVDDPSLDRHVPALRGVVYSEAIGDMPEPASPEKNPQ